MPEEIAVSTPSSFTLITSSLELLYSNVGLSQSVVIFNFISSPISNGSTDSISNVGILSPLHLFLHPTKLKIITNKQIEYNIFFIQILFLVI